MGLFEVLKRLDELVFEFEGSFINNDDNVDDVVIVVTPERFIVKVNGDQAQLILSPSITDLRDLIHVCEIYKIPVSVESGYVVFDPEGRGGENENP